MKIDLSATLKALEFNFKETDQSPFIPRKNAIVVMNQFIEDELHLTHRMRRRLIELQCIDKRIGIYDSLLTCMETADTLIWEMCGRRIGDPLLRYTFVQSRDLLEVQELYEVPDLSTWLETYTQSGYVPSKETLQLVTAYVDDCKFKTT